MKKILLLILILSPLSTNAWDNKKHLNQPEKNRPYESTMGNKYQYDLSDPVDKMDYSVDLDAQMRDKMNINPSRELDKGLGEIGGGIFDD